MTLTGIYRRAARDYGVPPLEYTPTMMKEWVEETEREACFRVRGLYGGSAGTIATAGNTRKTLPSARIFEIVQVWYKGRQLDETNEADLRRDYSEKWRTTIHSTPTKWYRDIGNAIGLFPVPTAGSGGTLVVYGNMATTGAYASGACSPRIPTVYHWWLKDGVCQRMALADKNKERAALWMQMHGQDWQQALRQMQRDFQPHPTVSASRT